MALIRDCGKKRTAAGASLPSPRDPRIEHSFDSGSDWDEDDQSLYLEHTGGLLCGVWNRCMDLSSWGAVDEENDMVLGESNSRSSSSSINYPKEATTATSASATAPTSAATAAAVSAAADEEDIWQFINLGHNESGDPGSGNIGSLSPLTSAPPLPPPSKDLGRRITTTETNSSHAGTAVAPPITAQPTPGSSRRQRPFFSSSDKRDGREAPALVPGSDVSRDCDSGGERVARRAPGDGGGLACLQREEDAAARGGAAGEGGGGPPAPPSRLGWSGRAAPDAGVAGEGAKKGQRRRKSLRGRRRQRNSGSMTVESLREECDFEGRPTQPLDKPEDSPFAAAFLVRQGGEEEEEEEEEEQQHLVFTGLLEGLEGARGQPAPPLRDMASRALFSVSSGRHGVEREVGPLQVGANGRVYGALQYPSMKELWPDIYNTQAVRAVAVDLLVEVRSRSRDVRYLRAELKVTYRRQGAGGNRGASWRP